MQALAEKMASSNQKFIEGLKDTMWERADHRDELLMGRGEICNKRILSVLPREQYHS